MLETWFKKQPPIEIYPRTPLIDHSATAGLVAKFWTYLISSKLYMLDTWFKKQPPIEIYPKIPCIDNSATTDPGGNIWNKLKIF